MTKTVTAPGQKVAPDTEPTSNEQLRKLILDVSPNPAALVFPTDKWGFTSDIKKAVLRAATVVKGQDDKHDLIMHTLAVLAAHLVARKGVDALFAAGRMDRKQAAADERAPRQRVSASVVAKPE